MYSNTSTVPSYDDLQPYFADLSTLPCLSDHEEADLLSRLRLAQQGRLSPEQARAAKQCLIEGCLRRVIRVAREQQPFSLDVPYEEDASLYGLDEADGRTLSRSEIAAHLGVALGTVKGDLWRAFHKLSATSMDAAQLAEQRRQEAEREARRQALCMAQEAERLARRAAQEASLEQAYARLEAQGLPITMLTLAWEAQVSTTIANAYLCRRWGTVAERLERAYVGLMQVGAAITVERLAKAARVGERAASDFLHKQRGTTRQARPRRKVVQQPA